MDVKEIRKLTKEGQKQQDLLKEAERNSYINYLFKRIKQAAERGETTFSKKLGIGTSKENESKFYIDHFKKLGFNCRLESNLRYEHEKKIS